MGANSSQVSSAGESFSEFSSNSVRQMWSFLDENGVHEIEIIHDIGSGARRVQHNGRIVAVGAAFSLFDTGASYPFPVGRARCMVTVTPEGSAFVYSLTIDGEAVDSYNRRVWNNCTRWFFTVDNEPHSCVVIDDNRFALILDGHAIETASDFTEHGSRHMVSVGAYQFVLEVFALDHDTAEPTTSCSSANISDAPPQLYPFQAAAEFNAFSSLSEPSVKQFHPLSSGELNSKSVNSPSSPMSPTNANATKSRKHRFTLSVDGQRITPDVQTRMLQPQLALGQPCARKLLAGLHSQAE